MTLLLFSAFVSSQNRLIDSLLLISVTGSHDTTKFYALMDLGHHYVMRQSDSAIYYHNLAKSFADKTGDEILKGKALIELGRDNYAIGEYEKAISFFMKVRTLSEKNRATTKEVSTAKRYNKLLASAISNLALVYMRQSDYSKAVENYSISLKLYEELDNKNGQANNLGNIGIVYDEQGDYPKALEYYFRALKINEESGFKDGQSANLANIGIVYFGEGDNDKALEYYEKALKINREIGNRVNEANNLGSIGLVQMNKDRLAIALEYFLKAKKIYLETGNKPGLANMFTNMGSVYLTRGDSAASEGKFLKDVYLRSFELHASAMKINEELGNKYGLTMNYVNLGVVSRALKKYSEAEQFLKKSCALAEEIQSLDEIRYAHESLSELYLETNRPALSLKHYKLFIKYRDSLLNVENTRASIQQEIKFSYGKKAAADSIRVEGEKKIIAVQLQHEQTQRYGLYCGLALLLLFAGFIFNRFKVTHRQKIIIEAKEKETQKQNEIISHQKHEVEEKQKEILDSIRYAKRIQSSLLPQEKMIEKTLNKLRS